MAGSAQKTVFVAGAVLGGVTLAEAVRHPGSLGEGGVYKRVWGIGILTLILGVAADVAPQLVVPFAVAVVVAFTIKNPGALSSLITGQSATPTVAKKPVTQGSSPAHTGAGR